MRFKTTIVSTGGNTTGVDVPPEVLAALDGGGRPKVVVTLEGHTYRSSGAPMGGRHLISLSAANRASAEVAGGDEVEVDVELDDQPRVVEVPADLAQALAGVDGARAAFDALSHSAKQRHVLAVEGAGPLRWWRVGPSASVLVVR